MATGRGRGARANLAGTPEATRLGLWLGTAAPAQDPGLALASATQQRGVFPRGRPRDPAWRSGAVLASLETRGSLATLFRLRSPLGMARPAVPGALTEKLLAGWELGRTRVPLSAANLAEEAFRHDGDPVSLRWNFTMLSSGETLVRQSYVKTWNKTEACVQHPLHPGVLQAMS